MKRFVEGEDRPRMGSTHFLTKTLEKAKTEMSLRVLADNLKRTITILSVGPLLKALAA